MMRMLTIERLLKGFTVEGFPPAPSFARNPHPREFEGDSRRSRTARKLRKIAADHAQTAVGIGNGKW